MGANAGLKDPGPLTAGFALQVPPPGVALSINAAAVLQSGGGMLSVGVKGLLMVKAMVLLAGQGCMVRETLKV